MKWRKLYKEDTEEGAFKVGDRVRVANTYKGKPTTGGRFSYDPPSAGMTGTVVDINRQRYHDFKSVSMGLGMGREKTKMWYIVKIDDSCRKGCFVPGEYGFDERDLVKIDTVNEAYEDVNIKKLLKQNGVTKLPSGTQFKPDRVSWSKDGGYAGRKTLDKVCSQLEDAGWKRGEWRTGGIPDGSAITNSNAYTSPDGQLVMTYSEHYGATAHDNFYGFTFKLAGGQVNEADEETDDGFARSDRPQIYRYYDDNETPIEEFVKHVHSAEHEIEDIFIQNSDVYENADDPWELFCDDMHGEHETLEESLDLDYYMNQAAYDKLPDDIKKYVYRSGGTCEFDAMQWLRGIFERLMSIRKDQVDESAITGNGRIDFDDDIVAVYTPDGKLEYKGLFDDCPYKDDDMKYDRTTMTYRVEGPRGDYRTIAKVAESCVNEASRFGFEVGDRVVLTKDKSNRFSGDFICAGTEGEIVAVDKPMPGVMKVKLEDGKTISVPERNLKLAGTDNEPWEKFKKPSKPKPSLREILDKHGPEEIYMEPAKPGSPKWTGD